MNVVSFKPPSLLLAGLLALPGSFSTASVSASNWNEQNIQAFLKQYCQDCHGATKQKGERRLDQLKLPAQDTDTLISLQEIADQLVLGDMPPEKAEQPSDEESVAVVRWIREDLRRYRETSSPTPRESVLRRLVAREYRQTLRDLLEINIQMFDPTREFPGELTEDHFDTVGRVQATTGFLLEQVLEAADLAIEKALAPSEKPVPQNWSFTAPFEQQPELTYPHKKAFDSRFLCLHETTHSEKHWGEYAPLLEFAQGAPVAGYYDIEILAEGLNRDHPHPPSKVDIDKEEPMLLGIVPGNRAFGELHQPQPFEETLASLEVPEGKPDWIRARIWLDQGFSPRFIYINGPAEARANQSSLGQKLQKQKGLENEQFGNHYAMAIVHAQLPHIRISEVRLSGPHYPEWPPSSHRAVLGSEGFQPGRTRDILERFATRAFRRPVTTEELDRIQAVAVNSKQSGRTDWESLKDALKAVLCAPQFLYLDKSTDPKGQLTAQALASRLSYFLWSTTPDAQLLASANSGALKTDDGLIREVRRMLEDPKSESFYQGFTDAWLNLRSLGSMPPDRGSFRIYYDKDLRPLMLEETRLFVRHVLEQNLGVSQFLDSDFTFVNRTLARHYRLPEVQGYAFQKVSLPPNSGRGGLLGHAGVLTVTANGIETSPVTRGVWILENLLGTPPPPPPDDVKPLDPDIRGAKTIREQLELHSLNANCRECHQSIDPPGFALEAFDPIGRIRNKYPSGRPVDSSGQLPNWGAFKDVAEFKELLLQRRAGFTRALTEKLLTYGVGRKPHILERQDLDELVEAVEAKGAGFRDLLEAVVLSPLFQRP